MFAFRIRRFGPGFTALALLMSACPGSAEQIDLLGPAGSGAFGKHALLLSNGNIVVADPDGPTSSRVYLYSASGTLISTLTGSAGDHLGSGGLVALPSGHYVILSPEFDGAGGSNSGAVTWGHAQTGTPATVTAANSLLGQNSGSGDRMHVTALSNGDYLVRTVFDSFGSVTWADGNGATAGFISAANSLVGSAFGDYVGGSDAPIGNPLLDLGNGRFAVFSPGWDNAAIADAGAVTRCNRDSCVGAVSSANSLVGTQFDDRVGFGAGVALGNGHFVVASPFWDHGAVADVGAVTWVNAGLPAVGSIAAGNSIIGASAGDAIGTLTSLGSGRYVIASPKWNHGAIADAGAVTFVNPVATPSGVVSASNSLVGSTSNDFVNVLVTRLPSRHYVVAAPGWNRGAITDAGAAIWGDGRTGIVGTVSSSNALVGSSAFDAIASNGGVFVLADGHYVVASPGWDNAGQSNVGAATWGDGESGVSGSITASNSLIGTNAGERLGMHVVALAQAGYAVAAPGWNSPTVAGVGAVRSSSGPRLVGQMSAATALTGTSTNDFIGATGLEALSDGGLAVRSEFWQSMRGAVTVLPGGSSATGIVTETNSITDVTPDIPARAYPQALPDGGFAFITALWRPASGGSPYGAVTLARQGSQGPINASNSVLGLVAEQGDSLRIVGYDAQRRRLVVAQPAANLISLFDERVFGNGFE
jgi:Repeat of unknown function (DUF5650)